MDVLGGIEESHWPLIRQVSMEVEPANKHHLPELLERFRSHGFIRLSVESLLGGPSRIEDPVACTLFAVRSSCGSSVNLVLSSLVGAYP